MAQHAIHLAIVHRNRLFRECLTSVLSDDATFHVTAVDHDDPDFPASIDEFRPDVVLLDLTLPQRLTVELTCHLSQSGEHTNIILLTYPNSEENLLECIAAGAKGVVLEDCTLEDLRSAIETVHVRGETFCSPKIVHSMFSRLAQTARESQWRQRVKPVELTPRELEIVHLIAERLSNKQIAKRLSLSLYTVKNHVHNIVEKLQVEDRHEAAEYARKRRWLKNTALEASNKKC